MVVPNNHDQPWVFLLKMIILGCLGGTIILGNTQMAELEIHILEPRKNKSLTHNCLVNFFLKGCLEDEGIQQGKRFF